MVEYVRLINEDLFQSIARNWHKPETLVLGAVLATVIVVAYFVTRK
jgi:hypothetical protein